MMREVTSDKQHGDQIINQLSQLFEPENPIPEQVLGVENFSQHIVENVVMNLKPDAPTVLTMCGIILMSVGLYFVLVRPALLPEDIRYIGLSSAQVQAVPSRFLNWLDKVFWVMGGYVFTSGFLTCYIAQTAFRERQRGVFGVVSVAGTTSLGIMVTINFLIDSDFKWLLLVFATLWFSALGLFLGRK
jgi:hypothetical protein